ncbi:DUF6998 domain-containing protein [Acetobacter orleanensis]|uniref:DUF6998 domain-containing protein n=1 Tax=Acetobacter orleanensis TaxID=104099 RepID=A0A4Y3TSC5_9PROT|nr:hypothetical protein [Acetobacter orleanensis]KXV66644.1 hypothetical protein AD949_01895 [Acetobacter orleanensis]PCD78205.1 hypothetical protein CO710_13600 [Acetobacter orleanensis]GAN69867.1 hypothetical protein Abol_143_003 [Acetobacter orleanensis JCM 7639]GBR21957.1 hypothetical protein AA0473_0002 [Acetobacter orleanensis NRIC 0473]GEB83987.1 hypothetical protein AOR01nite_24640 [Acetobacter orleanensis]
MGLSQIQIIRSLGDALAWLEKEVQWGVNPAELRHLTGRIGELYVAMKTRGQMALEVNQKGYDVVSVEGEQISVKTVTSTQYIRFNKNTLDVVHRVIVLRLNFDGDEISIEEIEDKSASDFWLQCRETQDSFIYSPYQQKVLIPLNDQKQIRRASYGPYEIIEYESGTIQIEKNGIPETVTKPALRELATSLGVNLLNNMGNARNTRQLGSEVISAIETLQKTPSF